MNKFIFTVSLFFATAFSVTAWAQPMQSNANKPCKELMMSCKAAGFEKHAQSGKDMRTCMRSLMEGQQVPGVTADPGVVQACKMKMQEHKKMKQGMPASTMPSSAMQQ